MSTALEQHGPETAAIELESMNVSRTTSRAANASTPAESTTRVVTPTPPITQLRAVTICISAFLVIFTTCGGIFSFGVYQELYQSMAHQPDNPFTGASPAAIDLIGTLSAAFMTIGAPLATAWTKRFSPRAIIWTGAATFFTSTILASYSVALWQFVLTQGFLMGLATCFSYMPAVTVCPTWYSKHRGLAMGIVLSGTGVGGLVWAPAIQALNEHLGFRNALRVSGSITTALILVGGFVLDWDPVSKARIKADKERAFARPGGRLRSVWDIPLVDWRVARSSKFFWQLFSTVFQAAAYYTPVFFFSAYARTLGYTPREGANFIAINNAFNAIGKVVLGVLADRWGRVNMLLYTTIISAVASFAFWLPSTIVALPAGRGLFITYAIMYGTFASAYVSLFPAALVELFGPQNFASVNGILYMARGLGSLFGTPTAGALIRGSGHLTDPGGYLHMVVLVGALLSAASFGVTFVRIVSKA